MRPAAFDSNSCCYYFNRLQPEGVRFVAYHKVVTGRAGVPRVVSRIAEYGARS
jgi:hypothetical protein